MAKTFIFIRCIGWVNYDEIRTFAKKYTSYLNGESMAFQGITGET